MKSNGYFLAFIMSTLVLITLLAGLACEGDDDDSSDDDNDSSSNNDDDDDNIDDDNVGDDDSNTSPDPECDDTNQPLLLAVHLYVNDVEVAIPATVLTTDTLKVGMEYSDADCNLAEGRIKIGIQSGEPEYYELSEAIPGLSFLITDEIGCSSEEVGEQYFVELDPAHFLVPADLNKTLPFVLVLYDVCSFCSIPAYLPLDFTVVEG